MIKFTNAAKLEIVYKALTGIVDCRLMFLGDYQRQLIRLFEEIAFRFRRTKDLQKLYNSLNSSAEIRQFYEIGKSDNKVSVTLRDQIFSEPGPIDEVEIDIKLSCKERVVTHPLPLDKMKALGNLLPLLQGKYEETQIVSRLNERLQGTDCYWAVEFLEILKKNSFITTVQHHRNYFMRNARRPCVTFLGHSSLLFQSDRSSVLIDPFLRRNYGLPEKALDLINLKLGAICCSHSHWDHCDLQTLLWFDKDTPVLIPRIVRPTGFNPPIAPALANLGFTDIREVSIWEPVHIDDIEIIPVPFHGEQEEPDIEMDHYTYVLKTDGLSIYGGVDCYKDTFGDMKPVLQRISQEHKPDIAFLPISKMIYEYRYGGPNSYCRYLDNNLIDASYQYTASPEEAAEWVNILDAKRVVPYAVFTFSRWSTPLEIPRFSKALNRVRLRDRLFPLRTLDSLHRSDLNAALSSEMRRKIVLLWFETGAFLLRYHRKMQKYAGYRFLRKVINRLTGKEITQ